MTSQTEVTGLVAGDSHAQQHSSSSSSAAGGGAGQLPVPNEHSVVGRTSSSSSRTVHIKEPPRIDTIPPPSSSGPPTATTGDSHGPLHQAIPAMPLSLAVACCVLNILLPGVGLYNFTSRFATYLTRL